LGGINVIAIPKGGDLRRIDSLKTVARAHKIEWRQPGTSHVTFRHPNGAKITVPAHRPIKPIYIKKFVRFVDEGIGE
jgi:predicted RNA binding protein YcfA (HicA-like mRNA interferase family)